MIAVGKPWSLWGLTQTGTGAMTTVGTKLQAVLGAILHTTMSTGMGKMHWETRQRWNHLSGEHRMLASLVGGRLASDSNLKHQSHKTTTVVFTLVRCLNRAKDKNEPGDETNDTLPLRKYPNRATHRRVTTVNSLTVYRCMSRQACLLYRRLPSFPND